MNIQLTMAQLLIVIATLLTEGCSTETWQRVGYETVQNIKAQQCQKDLSKDKLEECEKREDYDTYQKQRKDLQKAQ